MTLIQPGEVCPRCGLYHDPKDHEHDHAFPLERHATCRAIVSWRGSCECGEPSGGRMRFRLGEPPDPQWGILDFILRATGNDR